VLTGFVAMCSAGAIPNSHDLRHILRDRFRRDRLANNAKGDRLFRAFLGEVCMPSVAND
jgi:hypothetical protein